MKDYNHSFPKISFLCAASLTFSMMAIYAESIDVPADNTAILPGGTDESSYTLFGNWENPPEGGASKLVASAAGESTVTGSIYVNLFDYILSVPGSDLTIEGGISGAGASSYLLIGPANGSTITIRKNPITLPSGLDGLILFGDSSHQGTTILDVADNSWGGAIIQDGSNLQTTAANALDPEGTIMVHGELDLKGKDQAVGTLADDLTGGAMPGSTSGNITSATPATLTVNQVDVSFPGDEGVMQQSEGNFSGSISGAVSVIKQGSGTLNFGGLIDTSGTISVKVGTLGVSGTLKAHSLYVAKGARLAIKTGGKNPAITTENVSSAGSELDVTISSSDVTSSSDTIFLIVNNGRGAPPSPFKALSINGDSTSDPNSILLGGKKYRLVYNAAFNGPGSDKLANDIALVPVP